MGIVDNQYFGPVYEVKPISSTDASEIRMELVSSEILDALATKISEETTFFTTTEPEHNQLSGIYVSLFEMLPPKLNSPGEWQMKVKIKVISEFSFDVENKATIISSLFPINSTILTSLNSSTFTISYAEQIENTTFSCNENNFYFAEITIQISIPYHSANFSSESTLNNLEAKAENYEQKCLDFPSALLEKGLSWYFEDLSVPYVSIGELPAKIDGTGILITESPIDKPLFYRSFSISLKSRSRSKYIIENIQNLIISSKSFKNATIELNDDNKVFISAILPCNNTIFAEYIENELAYRLEITLTVIVVPSKSSWTNEYIKKEIPDLNYSAVSFGQVSHIWQCTPLIALKGVVRFLSAYSSKDIFIGPLSSNFPSRTVEILEIAPISDKDRRSFSFRYRARGNGNEFEQLQNRIYSLLPTSEQYLEISGGSIIKFSTLQATSPLKFEKTLFNGCYSTVAEFTFFATIQINWSTFELELLDNVAPEVELPALEKVEQDIMNLLKEQVFKSSFQFSCGKNSFIPLKAGEKSNRATLKISSANSNRVLTFILTLESDNRSIILAESEQIIKKFPLEYITESEQALVLSLTEQNFSEQILNANRYYQLTTKLSLSY